MSSSKTATVPTHTSNGPPDQIPDRSPSGTPRPLLGTKLVQKSVSFVAFLVVFLVYAIWLGDSFVNADTRALDVHQYVPVLLLGFAVLVTLVAGQFDLSVASMATLTTFLVVGLKIQQDWPFALVIAVCLAVGALGGALNGLLVVTLRVNTFIATLGTGGIFLGLSSAYSSGAQVTAGSGAGELPGWFSGRGSLGAAGSQFPAALLWAGLAAVAVMGFLAIRRMKPESMEPRRWSIVAALAVIIVAAGLLTVGLADWVDGVSWTIGVLLVVGVLLWLLLDHTTYGRYLRATGSNPVAASLSGIKPGRETFKAFVLGGVLAALAGIILGAGQGTASPGAATAFLLPAFAAAFLSTVILSAGRFHVWGTVVGGIFLVWVSQGLIIGGLPFTWTDVVNGVVLIIAVAFASVFGRRLT